MQKIIVVAESGSDITKEYAERYNIQIVPMHVNFDEETFDDGKFPVQKIVDYYKTTGKLPKTSGSVPEDFIKTFDEIHEKWPEAHILYIAYSAITTVSYQSAVIAAEDRDYVTCIDTKQVSVGQCAVVVQVAEYLEQHPDATIEEAVAETEKWIDKARMCFMPDNLEFLRAGGRVSNAAYLGAMILNLHPCIEILDGKLTATKKYRGKIKKVAAHFGKEVLTEIAEDDFFAAIPQLRKSCGDRAVMRAIHFYQENERVPKQVAALRSGDFDGFLKLVKESGYSSYMYLQNVIPAGYKEHQDMALALALCERYLKGQGAYRVHGGGFAGTVQAFVPFALLDDFKAGIDSVLGEGACHVLSIRPQGGVEMEVE